MLINRRSTAWAITCALAIGLLLALQSHALADPPKRPLPHYSGRDPEPTTAGDVALWVPRILLSPLYFTSEFLIRRPLGAAVAGAERAHLPTTLYDFFTFGPEHKAGFAPIAFVDLGFNPDVGIYLFWDDAGFAGNDLRVHAAAWNADWLAGSFTERIRLRHDDQLTLKFIASRRPDYAFYGIGPNTLQSAQSRYGADHIDGRARIELSLWRASRLTAGVGFRSVNLYHGRFGGDPSVEQAVAAGVFPSAPYGFDRGYTGEYNDLRLALDTRRADVSPGTGLRLEFDAEEGSDIRRSPGSGWLRYAATAGGFLDLNDHGRVVSLSVAALFADPLFADPLVGSTPIPFTELVSLGGDGLMRGFYPGRLVDRSAAVASLNYRWPIAAWLDGAIRTAVGNVFGAHLDGFQPRLLRFSGALGIETEGSPDGSVEVLVGFGTETFDHGAQVDSIRFALGTNRGF